jgi:DNA polymerase III delta prime subunit
MDAATSEDGVPTLLIAGPVGVGKSKVAREVSRQLWAAGLRNEEADLHPLPAEDPQPEVAGTRVAVQALGTAFWPQFRERGGERLIIAAAVQDPESLELVRRSLPEARITVVELHEPGRPAAGVGPPVEAGRPPEDVAREVLDRAGWLPG